MALSGKNHAAVVRLLLDAFSSNDELRREAGYLVAGVRSYVPESGSRADIADKLVVYADSRGALADLLAGLRQVRPGRAAEFDALAAQIGLGSTPPAPPAATPAPPSPPAKSYTVAQGTLDHYNEFMQWVTDPLGNGRSLFWFLQIAYSRVVTARDGLNAKTRDLQGEIDLRRRRDPLAPGVATQANALNNIRLATAPLSTLDAAVRNTSWEQIQRDLGNTAADPHKTAFTRETSRTLSAVKVAALGDLWELVRSYDLHLENAFPAIAGVLGPALWDAERSRVVEAVFRDALLRTERLLEDVRSVAQAKEDLFAAWD